MFAIQKKLITPHFFRTKYAEEFSDKLLNNIPCGTIYSSGVFISGDTGVGKSSFLQKDLIPQLEKRNVLVVYVDLMIAKNKSMTVAKAIKSAIDEKTYGLLGTISRLLGFRDNNITLKERIQFLINRNNKSVVLILDEVQIAQESQNGKDVMWALKSARDGIDNNINSRGDFRFIGAGSSAKIINSMAHWGSEAFYGARSEPFLCLDQDFLCWYQAERSQYNPAVPWPSLQALSTGFNLLGYRPERLIEVIDSLPQCKNLKSIDDIFIASCIASVHLAK